MSRIMPGSPAGKAGIVIGDIILRFDGKEITTSSSLPPIVGRTKIGESVPVVVMRNNKEKTLKVIIETLPQDAGKVIKTGNKPSQMMDERLAVQVAELTEKQREDYGLKKGGVFIV